MIEKIEKVVSRVIGKKVGTIMEAEKPEFGDYSTNASFILAKEYKKPPLEIARELAERLKKESGLFLKVEAAAPGFINFWISPAVLAKELTAVMRNTKKYAYTKVKKQKINLEFISANPTGPLTMANARGGFWGDVLANVLEAIGHKIWREYYINDAGNQIKLLGESILAALGKIPPKEEYYQGGYIKELARSTALRGSAEDIGRAAAKKLLTSIKSSVKNAGIKFNLWFSEYQNLHQKGKIKKVLALLEKKGLVERKEGAIWLKTSDIADEKDRVLVKSDGQPTYFLSDLAYHYDKLITRKFEKAIDIWGADHHGYAARLKAGLKALDIDPDRLKIIITQLVRLVEGGQEVKISKRAGKFVTLDDLIAEVGKDAVRFFFLMHTPDTHMDFDLALAKERSVKNPVYYVQYAFVRANSILTKANSKKITNYKLQNLNTEAEINLVRNLVKLPDVISQTAEDYNVSRLVRYVIAIARTFHNFYEKERVISESGEVVPERLALVAATKNILERLFKLLGIVAPAKM